MKKFDLRAKCKSVRERIFLNGTPAFAAVPLAAMPVFEVGAETSEMTTVLIGLMIAIVPLLIIMKLFTKIFDGFGK